MATNGNTRKKGARAEREAEGLLLALGYRHPWRPRKAAVYLPGRKAGPGRPPKKPRVISKSQDIFGAFDIIAISPPDRYTMGNIVLVQVCHDEGDASKRRKKIDALNIDPENCEQIVLARVKRAKGRKPGWLRWTLDEWGSGNWERDELPLYGE